MQIVGICRASASSSSSAVVALPANIVGPIMSDRAIVRPILDTFWCLLRTETDPEKRQAILALISEIEAKGEREGNSTKSRSLVFRTWRGDS